MAACFVEYYAQCLTPYIRPTINSLSILTTKTSVYASLRQIKTIRLPRISWCIPTCVRVISDNGPPKLIIAASEELLGRRVHPDPKHPECFETIQKWMDECFTGHQGCPGLVSAPLPTRVVDVGELDGSEEPRLHITEGLHGQWLSLSHRWGDQKFLTTTSKNLDDHVRRLPWSQLPKTFQDAIWVTRRLGFRYLWIDSLCIIQDSKPDWMIESSSMGNIYKNSVLTIAAGHPESPNQGMLAKRAPLLPQYSLPFSNPSFDAIELSYRNTKSNAIEVVGVQKVPVGTYSSIIDENTLSTRGWVVQETVLSPRTITWGQEGMIWQCRTCAGGEYEKKIHMADDVKWDLTPGHFHFPKRIFRPAKSSTIQPSYNWFFIFWLKLMEWIPRSWYFSHSRALYDDWYRILRLYFNCELTYKEDALVAIAGVAKEMETRTGDTYCAGLWLGDFCRGLLWYSNSLVDYVAPSIPSWSWASRKARNNLWFMVPKPTTDELKVVRVGRTKPAIDGLNEVTEVVVRGLIRVPPRDYSKDGLKIAFRKNEFYLPAQPEKATGQWLSYQLDLEGCLEASTEPGGRGLVFVDQTLCLVVGRSEEERFGILIRPSKEQQGAYQRTGCFRMDLKWQSKFGPWKRQDVLLV
jgi:hypothetical protein